VIYLDTSALLKTVLAEPESSGLLAWLRANSTLPSVSSDLTRIELVRALLRREPTFVPHGINALGNVVLCAIDESVVLRAMALPDPLLRSLDAIHLGTALGLQPQLNHFVTYDKRLAVAAQAHGLPVVAPG
jgi:predicted nucleic acid-binding protein